jgi:hypothetical protein
LLSKNKNMQNFTTVEASNMREECHQQQGMPVTAGMPATAGMPVAAVVSPLQKKASNSMDASNNMYNWNSRDASNSQ